MRLTVVLAGFVGLLAVVAGQGCSSDDTSTPAGTGGAATAGSSGAAGSTGGASGATGTGGAGQGGSAGTGGAGQGGSAGTAGDFITVVKGTLKGTDLAASKATHDAVAKGGESQAKAAGDIAHIPMLGTKHLNTTENEFFNIDRWNNYDNMTGFYKDPTFAAAFGQLFAAPPAVESLVRSDLYSWGNLDSGKGATRYFVYVRGKLKGPTPADAKAAHDAVAKAGETQATAAGDVAHVPFTDKVDALQFMDVDIWTSDAAIDSFYTDPNFQAAFGALFESPPTVAVYATSDWYSW